MKSYSLITKPYKIRLKEGLSHTLICPLTNLGMTCKEGNELFCAQVYSSDHSSFKSLFLFNNNFYCTFALGSKKVIEKWEIVDSLHDWREVLSKLQSTYLSLNMFVDGSIPGWVPVKEKITTKK